MTISATRARRLGKWGLYFWLTTVMTFALLSPQRVAMLGETTKNMYFHVSMSFTATIAFLASMWFSIQLLRTKNLDLDLKAEAAAGLGLLFNVLAMITGAIWARFTWGQFWNWDPKQTSIFILLLVYLTYFVLRSAIESSEKRARLAAVYNIFAFPSVIFLYFVLPRLVGGLHPGSDKGDVNPAVSSTTDPMIRVFLYSTTFGFIALFFWLHNLRYRQLKLAQAVDEHALLRNESMAHTHTVKTLEHV